MCLILSGDVDKILEYDLELAEASNPHGWGIHCAGEVVTSFDRPKFTSRDVLETMTGIVSIHYRFTTHGRTNKANCHPHSLGNDIWLMHNGVLRDAMFQCPKDKKSDTAMLASYMRGMNWDQCKFVLKMLDGWDRFLLLDPMRRFASGDWYHIKKDDVWHSNSCVLRPAKSKGFCDPRKEIIIPREDLDYDPNDMALDADMRDAEFKDFVFDDDEDAEYLRRTDPFFAPRY